MSGDQGHSSGAYPGPLLSGDQGWRREQNRLGGSKDSVVRLRVGSANVGTLRERCGEITDMAWRRQLDICCLQEVRWKEGSARTLEVAGARYKLFWIGCDQGVSGFGVMVSEKWMEHVVEVKRISERLLVVRLAIGRVILNVVSVYASQGGRPMAEKEKLLAQLGKVVSMISGDEGLIVCGDFNGHVDSASDGFERVHGGRGFGSRNMQGECFWSFRLQWNSLWQTRGLLRVTRKKSLTSQVECRLWWTICW